MTDAIYIDTSCVLKLLISEADSAEVRRSCTSASDIVVSSLTELETRSRLLALRRGGSIGEGGYRRLTTRLERVLTRDPFHVQPLGGDVFDEAIAQLKLRGAASCKSLDRLHLAAMHILGLKSIMTRDARQAAVAKSLGYTVIA